MLTVDRDVSMAGLTTLELGGAARFFVEAPDEPTVGEALAWARQRGVEVFVLGGGSNLVVGDAGYDGLVLRIAMRGSSFGEDGIVRVAAGESWDAVVAESVARGLAGLECLSGIPGLAGATPIQNVGAYGQEVAETLRAVRVLDRVTGAIEELPATACGFSYRDSAFKRAPERHVVLGVTFGLRPGGAPTLRYPELQKALAGVAAPSLAEARAAVLALRRRKSMVIDLADPNRRSVGSFFTNPIVPAAEAARLVDRALAEGIVARRDEVPLFPAADGAVKLAAGWLIERSGCARGMRRGPVGISSHHALALVHHGEGTTAALVALAREVRDRVEARFGVRLVPEPTLLGVTI